MEVRLEEIGWWRYVVVGGSGPWQLVGGWHIGVSLRICCYYQNTSLGFSS